MTPKKSLGESAETEAEANMAASATVSATDSPSTIGLIPDSLLLILIFIIFLIRPSHLNAGQA